MTFQEIFTIYYSLYRGDDEVIAPSEAEYKTAINMANNAIQRWANVDGVLWNELLTALSDSVTGDKEVIGGVEAYSVPTDFKHVGGYVLLISPEDQEVRIPVKQPQEAQISRGGFAYIRNNKNNTIKLVLSESARTNREGWTINYPYYKQPIFLDRVTETGSTVVEMYDPMFVVHHILANRFRASRNWSGYQSAMRDAEIALQGMQHKNVMGTHYNLWNFDGDSTAFGA